MKSRCRLPSHRWLAFRAEKKCEAKTSPCEDDIIVISSKGLSKGQVEMHNAAGVGLLSMQC
jgi:hypothetical protein